MKYRAYIIGTGVIAGFHMQALQRHYKDNLEVHACDVSDRALQTFLSAYPLAKGHLSLEQMLAPPPQPGDIVILSSPPFTHHKLALVALNSGRHVLCEKPLAMNSEEVMDMVATAKRLGLLIACCSSRFLGTQTQLKAKSLLDENRLGVLSLIRWVARQNRFRSGIEYQPASRWFLDKSKNGGGVLMDWGPYDFTMLNHLLQPEMVEVLTAGCSFPITHHEIPAGTVQNVEFHAWAHLVYHLARGVRVPVIFERASATHGSPQRCFEIEGLEGAMSLHWYEGHAVRYSWDEGGKLMSSEFKFQETDSPHSRPLLHLCDRIAGKASPALVNEQALFNFRCLRAIYDCHQTGTPQKIKKNPS